MPIYGKTLVGYRRLSLDDLEREKLYLQFVLRQPRDSLCFVNRTTTDYKEALKRVNKVLSEKKKK
jgi:hypothetical protein